MPIFSVGGYIFNNIREGLITKAFIHNLLQLWRSPKKTFVFGQSIPRSFWDYPRHSKSQVSQFDIFHICDQSYALNGFRRSAVVFYTTQAVRDAILHYQLISFHKLVQVPLEIAPEFSFSNTNSNMMTTNIQQQIGDRPFILNISGNLQRKRLDVLLETYARLRYYHPELLLVRVGPQWEPKIQTRIERLGIQHGIRLFSKLEQKDLVELYRRAAIVLMTSESEGFGMPLIEALACGSVAVVSDIPVLREVGGNAAVYCPVGKPDVWAKTITHLLNHPEAAPALSLRLNQVKNYTWSLHTETIAQAYQEMVLWMTQRKCYL